MILAGLVWMIFSPLAFANAAENSVATYLWDDSLHTVPARSEKPLVPAGEKVADKELLWQSFLFLYQPDGIFIRIPDYALC
ncbi:MAG: hypothetical protein QGD92_14805, partial [Gammaproteobacteria bacterium]|nr:hypothetical protein [Gammaproteobacteria bacterium]